MVFVVLCFLFFWVLLFCFVLFFGCFVVVAFSLVSLENERTLTSRCLQGSPWIALLRSLDAKTLKGPTHRAGLLRSLSHFPRA